MPAKSPNCGGGGAARKRFEGVRLASAWFANADKALNNPNSHDVNDLPCPLADIHPGLIRNIFMVTIKSVRLIRLYFSAIGILAEGSEHHQ